MTLAPRHLRPALAAAALAALLLGVAAEVPVTAAASVQIPVPMYRQQYSLDCEAAALQMALRFQGSTVSQDRVLTEFGDDPRAGYYDSSGRLRWGDPFRSFVGNVRGSELDLTGYGAYWPVIARSAAALGGRVSWSGAGLGTPRLYAALAGGHPVQVWLTYDYSRPARRDYLAFDGVTIPYAGPSEHSILLTGISDTSLLVNDPARGQYWVSKSTFVPAWGVYGQMAVVFAGPTSAPGWAGTNVDGRLEALVRDGSGALWHTWQISPGGGWNPPQRLGGAFSGPPSVTSNRDGSIEAFGRGSDGSLWHVFQTRFGWKGPWPLGGSLAGRPVALPNRDGRLEVFWVGSDGGLWHSYQVTPGGGWRGPGPLGGTGLTGDVGAARNLDGRLEVFARTSSGVVLHVWQNTAGGGWSAPAYLTNNAAGSPAALAAPSGTLQVVYRANGGAVAVDGQLQPGGGWSGPKQIGGAAAGDPVVAAGWAGGLVILFRDSAGALWEAALGSQGWTTPWSLGGTAAADPAVQINYNGRLELFYIGTDGGLWHRWQTSLGGSWSAPASLGGSWSP